MANCTIKLLIGEQDKDNVFNISREDDCVWIQAPIGPNLDAEIFLHPSTFASLKVAIARAEAAHRDA